MGSRPTEHLETELKFEVGLDFVLPDLGGLADGVAVTAPDVDLLVASGPDGQAWSQEGNPVQIPVIPTITPVAWARMLLVWLQGLTVR